MPNDKPTPTGQPFSRVYLDRGAPTKDSERFRIRLSAQANDLLPYVNGKNHRTDFAAYLTRELGVAMPSLGGRLEPAFIFREAAELRDALDSITHVYKYLVRYRNAAVARSWFEFVGRVIREENVGYRIDAHCGVHYYEDEEFERARAATLAVLQHPSLGNALHSFEAAYEHLDRDPQDTKAAVRSIFEAAEIIARQICPGHKNLHVRLAKGELKSRCVATMQGDETQGKVFEGMFAALGEWVDAIHHYRHGQPADVPVAPSEELAVHVISIGAAHVRLLAQCYLRIAAAAPAP